jgi:hypothetical protein
VLERQHEPPGRGRESPVVAAISGSVALAPALLTLRSTARPRASDCEVAAAFERASGEGVSVSMERRVREMAWEGIEKVLWAGLTTA